MRARRILTTLLLILGSGAATRGHDFWIEPSIYTPAAGQRVTLRLRVGEGFVGDEVARAAGTEVRFIAHDAEGIRNVPGLAGTRPAGFLTARAPGAIAIGYEGPASFIELEAETFEAYLEEEGLLAILEARAKQGQREDPGRELFSRSVKSLLSVTENDGVPVGASTELGLPLELNVDSDPYALQPGATLGLQLLLHGKPLPDALIVARPATAREDGRNLRTDATGRAVLVLDSAGPWLVKSVHMEAAPLDSQADWQSLWTSLTFSVPAAVPAPASSAGPAGPAAATGTIQ